MRKSYVVGICVLLMAFLHFSFSTPSIPAYKNLYHSQLDSVSANLQVALALLPRYASGISTKEDLKKQVDKARTAMKAIDFWLRYLQPLAYKSMNAPLPVEWETEVFEKFEKPYRRDGGGLTLAALDLAGDSLHLDALAKHLDAALQATAVYAADSVTGPLGTYHHFFLCNRLFLLNLAAIYSTGFECPDPARVIPELDDMLLATAGIYGSFNTAYPATPLPDSFLNLYRQMMVFVQGQPRDNSLFDHYTFIRDYVNPLFVQNQRLILQYGVVSRSLVDYSLNKQAVSIFDKALYNGQNPKGIFLRVDDTAVLADMERIGKLLFYDPILSGNDERSCASCHKPLQYFTDTVLRAPFHFNHQEGLPRNAPSLVNAVYNHLLMLDGKHISLQSQAADVVSNPAEMNCAEKEAIAKVLSCREYKRGFSELLQHTPQEKEITFAHIASCITWYYSKFSRYYAPFDDAMNRKADLGRDVQDGFNLFMGKAQCATCHFVPQFNGVKPPYIGSEFEVLGVPADTGYTRLSPDSGKYAVHAAPETRSAFRTGSLRNALHTAPYMHNGVFRNLNQVIDFYDAGGGAGHGLRVANQTLSADSLHLTSFEKQKLLAFMATLDERIIFEAPPVKLPASTNKHRNSRKPGGIY